MYGEPSALGLLLSYGNSAQIRRRDLPVIETLYVGKPEQLTFSRFQLSQGGANVNLGIDIVFARYVGQILERLFCNTASAIMASTVMEKIGCNPE